MHHEITRLSSLLARVSKRAIIAAVAVCTAAAAAPLRPNDVKTATPIKHVIVIIGENRSFDHIFAAYKPRPGQSVLNLLSEGIIKEDGTPGPNFSKAAQNQAQVTLTYESAPAQKKAYATLPPAMTGAPRRPPAKTALHSGRRRWPHSMLVFRPPISTCC